MVIQITISNRAAYTFLAVILLTILGTGVYAYGTTNPSVMGHTWEEIADIPEGFADGVDDMLTDSDISNMGYRKTDNVNDADSSPSNEIQSLSISGRTISLSGGGSVTVPLSPDTNAATICGDNQFLDGDGDCHGYIEGNRNLGEDFYGAHNSGSGSWDTCGAQPRCGDYFYECKPGDNFECNDAYDAQEVRSCGDDQVGRYSRKVICRVPKILV